MPEIAEHDRAAFPSLGFLAEALPGLQVEPVPIPADCSDGFSIGLWSRPKVHLDPRVRQAASIWHRLPASVVERALDHLRRDIESGERERRNGYLRERDELDVGIRLISAELR